MLNLPILKCSTMAARNQKIREMINEFIMLNSPLRYFSTLKIAKKATARRRDSIATSTVPDFSIEQ